MQCNAIYHSHHPVHGSPRRYLSYNLKVVTIAHVTHRPPPGSGQLPVCSLYILQLLILVTTFFVKNSLKNDTQPERGLSCSRPLLGLWTLPPSPCRGSPPSVTPGNCLDFSSSQSLQTFQDSSQWKDSESSIVLTLWLKLFPVCWACSCTWLSCTDTSRAIGKPLGELTPRTALAWPQRAQPSSPRAVLLNLEVPAHPGNSRTFGGKSLVSFPLT